MIKALTKTQIYIKQGDIDLKGNYIEVSQLNTPKIKYIWYRCETIYYTTVYIRKVTRFKNTHKYVT